jgi:hypothetical protein
VTATPTRAPAEPADPIRTALTLHFPVLYRRVHFLVISVCGPFRPRYVEHRLAGELLVSRNAARWRLRSLKLVTGTM